MNAGIGDVMRHVKPELAGQLLRRLQRCSLPEHIMHRFVLLGPFVGHGYISKVQIRYRVCPQARFDRLLVALGDQNMNVHAARREVSGPIPANPGLAAGVRPASVGGK